MSDVSKEKLKNYCDNLNKYGKFFKKFSKENLQKIKSNKATDEDLREAVKATIKIKYKTRSTDQNYRMWVNRKGENKNTNLSVIYKNGKWIPEHIADRMIRQTYHTSPAVELFLDNKAKLQYRHNVLAKEFAQFIKRKYDVNVVAYDAKRKVTDPDDLRKGARPDFEALALNNFEYYGEYCHRCCVEKKRINDYIAKYPTGKIMIGVLAISKSGIEAARSNDRVELYCPDITQDGSITWNNILK
jgi:hypothetical protein